MFLMLLLVLFSLFISMTQGYLIDDHSSIITYIPSDPSGPNPWLPYPNASAYQGTTTDNACTTEQGCRCGFSFNGSGITLVRSVVPSIPIPLNATVTVDGVVRPNILVPDGNPESIVYSLQSLDYGAHVAEVTLVSYNGDKSHFRLDYVDVNETTPLQTTTTTSSPLPTATETSLPSKSTPSPSRKLTTKKVPVIPVVGGIVGGLVMTILIGLLVHARNRRKTYAISEDGLDDDDTRITPFTPSVAGPNLPTLTSVTTLPSPLARPISINTTATVSAPRLPPRYPRDSRHLSNEQPLMAGLYHERVSAPNVIVRDGSDEGPSSEGEIMGGYRVAPPAYDFKTAASDTGCSNL